MGNSYFEMTKEMLDAMTVQDLESFLREDALLGDDGEKDSELVLYALELLEQKGENPSATAGQTRKAWERLHKYYLPEAGAAKKNCRCVLRWMGAVTAAACVILVLMINGLTTRAGDVDMEGAVVCWNDEIIYFSVPEEDREPIIAEYDEMDQLLQAYKISGVIPKWIPEGYTLCGLDQYETHQVLSVRSSYKKGEQELTFQIRYHLKDIQSSGYVKDETPVEEFYYAGQVHYLYSNMDRKGALWLNGRWECSVRGVSTYEELKQIIMSMYEESE